MEHTRIQQLGINRDVHYKIASDERWKEIGDLLAPKAPWAGLIDPKTLEVVMQGNRPDSDAKYIRTNVLASPLFPGKQVLAIRTNEHYTWDSASSAHEAVHAINENWDAAYHFAKQLGESILSVGEAS